MSDSSIQIFDTKARIKAEKGVGSVTANANGSITGAMVYLVDESVSADKVHELLIRMVGMPAGPDFSGTPQTPHAHPHFPALKCSRATIRGLGEFRERTAQDSQQTTIDWGTWVVDADYTLPIASFGPPSGGTEQEQTRQVGLVQVPNVDVVAPYLDITTTAGGEWFTVKRRYYRWVDETIQGNLGNVDFPFAVFVPTLRHTFKWRNVASVNGQLLRSLYGSVNADFFPPGQFNSNFHIKPGRGMLSGVDIQSSIGPALKRFTVSVTVEERVPAPWNYAIAPGYLNADPDLGYWHEMRPERFPVKNWTNFFNAISSAA